MGGRGRNTAVDRPRSPSSEVQPRFFLNGEEPDSLDALLERSAQSTRNARGIWRAHTRLDAGPVHSNANICNVTLHWELPNFDGDRECPGVMVHTTRTPQPHSQPVLEPLQHRGN